MEKTQKIANEKQYGTVVFGGKKYILTQQAYCDNYGTDDRVCYYAQAVADDNADEQVYKVIWDTTGTWDSHQRGGDIHPYETDEYGNDTYPNNETCNFCEDESNACDWDSPIDVIVVG